MVSCESKSLSVLHQFDPHRPLKPPILCRVSAESSN